MRLAGHRSQFNADDRNQNLPTKPSYLTTEFCASQPKLSHGKRLKIAKAHSLALHTLHI